MVPKLVYVSLAAMPLNINLTKNILGLLWTAGNNERSDETRVDYNRSIITQSPLSSFLTVLCIGFHSTGE